MKGGIILIGLMLYSNLTYLNAQTVPEDQACHRKINIQISAILKKKFNQKYDLNEGQIRIMMKFCIKRNGSVDSIVILKSNLSDFGIEENFLKRKLSKKRYKCIRNVYYSKRIKPTGVVVFFNPKLK